MPADREDPNQNWVQLHLAYFSLADLNNGLPAEQFITSVMELIDGFRL